MFTWNTIMLGVAGDDHQKPYAFKLLFKKRHLRHLRDIVHV